MAISKLHIEAIQTVVPTKPTDPRKSCKITVQQNLNPNSILQRRFNIILCYNKAYEDDSGWVVAGRIKESLGKALEEEPILAGRLKQCDEKSCTDDFQIVANDSGVRMIEGRIEMKLADFLEVKDKGEDEADLVFWEDVQHNPQYSPLFYVQVTNFSCGGYSIGISCSHLLVDPFALTSFIKKWADVHNSMASKTDAPKLPIFYHPYLGNPSPSSTLLMGSNTGIRTAADSLIFTITTKIFNLDSKILKNIAELCISEAERELGTKMASNFTMFVKDDEAKLEICSRSEGVLEGFSDSINGLSCARTWDELGLESVCLNQGMKPAYVSCWINSVLDEGSVMIIPSSDDVLGMKIVVTFTKKK